MSITIKYEKRKNNQLFNKFNQIQLLSTQNYIPIYDRFFSLNNTNWNSINLNHNWSICDIKERKITDPNILHCKLKYIDDEEITDNRQIFIKLAPLLDPFKYLLGKYNHNDAHLFNLPTHEKEKDVIVHPKMADPNNSSFIDGFFSFLSSKVLYHHQFIHGLDYYGSFLSIKNDYKINVIDDIDYLIQSDFFNYHKNKLFHIEDYSHLILNNQTTKLKPLKISTSIKSNLSVVSIDQNIFENIFEETLSLEDIKNNGVDIVDITNSSCFELSNIDKYKTLKSESSCSSRTSHTNENDFSDEEDNFSDEDKEEGQEIDQDQDQDQDQGDENDWEDCDDDDDDDDKTLTVTFPKFPVQVICMEKCEDTLDNLIINELLNEDEWFSALMQIIMILLTYQKMFSFTHNDLHTNNIMYVSTNKKFIYYVFKKKTYKVPTFGKIYKIIDFGRAIYKFQGKLFCSDSFQVGGDASTQYNTEPYFNEKKPRLDPNFSFDLCRLACSIFDYVVDDLNSIKNLDNCPKIVKLIVEWCIDDNGINVLYKNNGCERYPDFKLYKMIARCVHNHTPQAQLERPEFSKYSILSKNVPKNESVINIDNLPSYVS
jgi:hypothetical protein